MNAWFPRDSRGLVAVLGAAVAFAALGFAGTAAAQPPTTEKISISWAATSPPPTSSPFRGIGVGTFNTTGTVTDAGTLTATAQDVAVPSPNHGTLDAVFTLNSNSGSGGTLTLRCKSTATDYSDLTAIPGSGTCAIIGGGSGVWAGMHGQGTLSSLTDGIGRTEIDTIVLSIV